MRLGPNTCSNILEIKGNKDDIIKFFKGLYGHTSIYNRYNKKQYIENKEKEFNKKKYPTFNTYAKISETIELYGYNCFGDKYYLEKWGTKLDTLIYYSKEIEDEINKIIKYQHEICVSKIQFDTFRTPPIKWIEACSNLNPKIFFTLEYIDYKNNKGCKKIKKGNFFT